MPEQTKKPKKFYKILAGIALVCALLWFVFTGPFSLESRVIRSSQKPLQTAISDIQGLAPSSGRQKDRGSCSRTILKGPSTDCYVSKKYVAHQTGDAFINLKQLDNSLVELGWNSELNILFFEDFNKKFIEPLPSQGYRALAAISYLSYTKIIDGRQIILSIYIKPSADENGSSDPYSTENSEARQAIKSQDYYLHINTLYHQHYSGLRYF